MQIGELLKNTFDNTQSREGPKIEFEFQDLGVEMMDHFGKQYRSRIWPIFYKKEYPVPLIRDAWFVYKKKGIKDWRYFMGILNRLAVK